MTLQTWALRHLCPLCRLCPLYRLCQVQFQSYFQRQCWTSCFNNISITYRSTSYISRWRLILNRKTSWRCLVQQAYPPQTAWDLCRHLPQNRRNNVTQECARQWLNLSDAQIKTIIEFSCEEITFINQLLSVPTTSVVLVKDERLPSKQAIVLCHNHDSNSGLGYHSP